MYNLRPSIDECSQKGYGDGAKIQLFKSVKVSKIETGAIIGRRRPPIF